MENLTLAFSRSFSIGAPFIRGADRWGRWSHCGIVTADGRHVLEARAFHGVTKTTCDEFADRATDLELNVVRVVDAALALSWAEAQVGKGYDYVAILGNLFREPWQSDDRHHCAEYVAKALLHGGRRLFRVEPWKVSPNLIWMVT